MKLHGSAFAGDAESCGSAERAKAAEGRMSSTRADTDSPRAASEVGGHAGPGSEPLEQRSHAEQQLLATIGRNQLHGHRGPGLWVEPGGNRDRRVTGVVPGGGVRRVARAVPRP